MDWGGGLVCMSVCVGGWVGGRVVVGWRRRAEMSSPLAGSAEWRVARGAEWVQGRYTGLAPRAWAGQGQISAHRRQPGRQAGPP